MKNNKMKHRQLALTQKAGRIWRDVTEEGTLKLPIVETLLQSQKPGRLWRDNNAL